MEGVIQYFQIYEEIRDISGVFFQAAYELSRDLPDAD